MKFRVLILSCLFALSFFGCKDKLEVNAPYKEIPSIYAILDPSEDKQMIRINKVFLGEGDANKMAKVSDSINYPENELTVSLRRYLSGVRAAASKSSNDSVIIFTEEMIQAQPGSFSTNQRVYVTTQKLFEDGEYRITVKNNHTGNVFKSKANSIKPITFAAFKPLGVPPYYPNYPPTADPKTDYIDYSVDAKVYDIRYTVNEAYIYQLVLRYHLIDSSAGSSEQFLADYNAGTKTIKDVQKLSGLTFLSHTFQGAGIYTSIANDMAKRSLPGVGRKPVFIEYIVYSSTLEYADYMEYSKPSLSISQNKPLYSNFEGGNALGLFTFRTKISVNKMPSKDYINGFARNAITCRYRFLDQFNGVPGCK